MVGVECDIVVLVGEVGSDDSTWWVWSGELLCQFLWCHMCDEAECVVRGVGVRCESGCSMVVCV